MDEQLTNNMTFVPHSQFRRPSSNCYRGGMLIRNIVLFSQKVGRLLKARGVGRALLSDPINVVNSSLVFLLKGHFVLCVCYFRV